MPLPTGCRPSTPRVFSPRHQARQHLRARTDPGLIRFRRLAPGDRRRHQEHHVRIDAGLRPARAVLERRQPGAMDRYLRDGRRALPRVRQRQSAGRGEPDESRHRSRQALGAARAGERAAPALGGMGVDARRASAPAKRAGWSGPDGAATRPWRRGFRAIAPTLRPGRELYPRPVRGPCTTTIRDGCRPRSPFPAGAGGSLPPAGGVALAGSFVQAA